MVAAALTVRELIEILSEAPMDGRVLSCTALPVSCVHLIC
jgi:hypothetical protein